MYSLRSIKTGTGDSRELHLLGMARMIGPAFHTPDRAFNPYGKASLPIGVNPLIA